MYFPSDDELMAGPNALDGVDFDELDLDNLAEEAGADQEGRGGFLEDSSEEGTDEDLDGVLDEASAEDADAAASELADLRALRLEAAQAALANAEAMSEGGGVDVTSGAGASSADAGVGLMMPDFPEDFRAGFVSIVGRPNVGKSTLTNALVGQKVAITSGRPETTRHNIRGIVHREKSQLVLVDTPGYHRPRTLLGKRLNDMVREALAEVDVVVFCMPADQKIGPGDRFIARELQDVRRPIIAVATKCDLVSRERLMRHLIDIDKLGEWAAIVPVSALAGERIDMLVDVLSEHVPLSPPLYPSDGVTDESRDTLIAEFIREAALEGIHDELPHSLAVQVEEVIEREARPGQKGKPLLDVYVNVYVERDSQKAIIIGKGGSRLKDIGSKARAEIETLLGRKIFLSLHVRTAKDWQSDPKMLGRLGF